VDDWVTVEAGPQRGQTLMRRVREELPLLSIWTGRTFQTRYRQSALDVLWSVVNPIAVLLIYGFVFTQAFSVTGDGVPYLSLAWSGLVVWTFASSTVQLAAQSMAAAADTIAKVYFSREVVPLAEVGAGAIDLGIWFVLLVGLALVQGVSIGVTAVAVVPALLLLLVWTAGASVFVGVVSVFVRDVRPTIGLLVRVGFIATPVMYPVSALPESVRWTADVNPIAVVIEAIRDALLRGTWPQWPLLLVHLVAGVVVLVASVAYTRAVEHRMVDVL
jgi:lipopolysaccharide transport system permease protein